MPSEGPIEGQIEGPVEGSYGPRESPAQRPLAASLRDLVDPVVVAAFAGWNDGASAASGAVEHLSLVYDAELAFAIDPDDFYDFQVNRPDVRIAGTERVVDWPTTEVKVARHPSGRDLVIIEGLEPNLRWRQFATTLTSALRSTGAAEVYLLGALLADTPHTRPIPVEASVRTAREGAERGLEVSAYEGPTGIVGILADAWSRAGFDVVSIWAAVPHYVSHPPCPKATLALLTRLEGFMDLPVELGELPELSRAWERGVDELAAEDSEVAEYVTALEEQQDTAELPEASGDAIAAEFERYLRRRQQG